MPLNKRFERLKFIDSLIRRKATGNVKTLAKKLNLSASGTEKIIHEMKEAGFPISYCKKRKSYIYNKEGRIVENLFVEELQRDEMQQVNGGEGFFQFFSKRTYSKF